MRPLETGQRSETVRRANLSVIVRALHDRGPLSRSELVARTGLTRSAIRSHVGELEAAGIVREEQPAPLGLPGRPSPVVSLDGEVASVLALEIAVDSLAAAHMGPAGEIVRMRRVERPRGHASVDRVVTDLAALARAVHPGPLDAGSLIGIGLAVAGVVRRDDGLVRTAPNLGWTDVALVSRMAEALGTRVPVHVANEADLGALAESRRGAGLGADDVIYISGEVGIGGGIFVDGRPLGGAAGYGGEIGHIPVNPAGAACRCGAMGCWETEIGEEVLLGLAGQAPRGGRAAVDAVLSAAAADEPAALAAIDHIGRWLGIGLAGLVNVFDPRLIVLGGRFVRLAPYVVATVEAELDRRALAASRELVRVVPAMLGEDAPLIGAAELAMEPLLTDPSAWLGARAEVGAERDSGPTNGQWRVVA
ncbi:MAG TPA: ROK family transcriptional regulator [Candidatus Limnocylindrales bacterium]|jgi:predicted NBD/HSP70 family sugar kinase